MEDISLRKRYNSGLPGHDCQQLEPLLGVRRPQQEVAGSSSKYRAIRVE